MLRAENWQASSHEAADQPMAPTTTEQPQVDVSDVRAAWMAFGKAKRIYRLVLFPLSYLQLKYLLRERIHRVLCRSHI